MAALLLPRTMAVSKSLIEFPFFIVLLLLGSDIAFEKHPTASVQSFLNKMFPL